MIQTVGVLLSIKHPWHKPSSAGRHVLLFLRRSFAAHSTNAVFLSATHYILLSPSTLALMTSPDHLLQHLASPQPTYLSIQHLPNPCTATLSTSSAHLDQHLAAVQPTYSSTQRLWSSTYLQQYSRSPTHQYQHSASLYPPIATLSILIAQPLHISIQHLLSPPISAYSMSLACLHQHSAPAQLIPPTAELRWPPGGRIRSISVRYIYFIQYSRMFNKKF